MSKSLTTEQFIQKAKQIHGDKYNYSKVEYINNKTKVCIICSQHGEFWQTPSRHLEGRNCLKCMNDIKHNKQRKTTEQFIQDAKKIHGDRYDYSKIEYISASTKICIIDHTINPNTGKEFGEFWQTPNSHLRGSENEKSSYIKRGINKRIAQKEFIKKCNEIHKNRFDYSKLIYKGSDKKICIIDHTINPNTGKEFGEFWEFASHHYKGRIPRQIESIYRGIEKRKTTEQFIQDAKKIHGDRYNYSKVNYINDSTPVCIICPEHGEFWQVPRGHLNYHGCLKCKTSKLQTKIRIELEQNKIEYIEECNKKILCFAKRFKFDFYLPRKNILIECQGGQHLYKINYFGNKLNEVIKRDIEKYNLSKENNIHLLYFVNRNEFKDEYYNNPLFSNIYQKENVFFDVNELINYIK